MGNSSAGWTPERRKRQSEAIRRWKPWNQSTGPKSAEGKAATARNAWTGGHLAMLRQLSRALHEVMRSRDYPADDAPGRPRGKEFSHPPCKDESLEKGGSEVKTGEQTGERNRFFE